MDPVEVDGEFYHRIPSQACVQDTVTFKPLQGCLSLARGVAKCEFGLLFKAEAWMTPTRYLCTQKVLQMPSSFIAAWCRLLGLQLGRCSHAERVRQLLQREAFDDAYIQEVIDALPTPQARARAQAPDRLGRKLYKEVNTCGCNDENKK